MNIEDKAGLYREVRRAVKPHGRFGIYDIMGDEKSLHYPVPWATTRQTSFLAAPKKTQELLRESGFAILEVENRRDFALEALRKLQSSNAAGPRIVMGDHYLTKIANLLRNIEEGLCEPWQIVCRHDGAGYL
jgi:hypothetical protein